MKLSTNKMACKCLNCGLINIFSSKTCDGNTCIRCDGAVVPIGYAVIKELKLKTNSIGININVDTTELDMALDKARELKSIIDETDKVKEKEHGMIHFDKRKDAIRFEEDVINNYARLCDYKRYNGYCTSWVD